MIKYRCISFACPYTCEINTDTIPICCIRDGTHAIWRTETESERSLRERRQAAKCMNYGKHETRAGSAINNGKEA